MEFIDHLNNTNYEPMDIDLSAHSNYAMDISFFSSSSANETDIHWEADTSHMQAAEPTAPKTAVSPALLKAASSPAPISNTNQIKNIKKFHINLHKQTTFHITTKIKIFSATVVLLISVMTYQVLNIHCSGDINPEILQKTLSSKLYGQTRAVGSLIEALSVKERSKILIFYGGTGVGKTFTASMVLEHIGCYSNVYHYTMPTFMDTFTTDFMIGLTVCKHTTVIIDDLSSKDVAVRTHLKDVILKSQNLDKDITVILIYNCLNAAKDFERQCDETLPKRLLHDFSHIDAFKKLIKFESLKEEHLRKCIETELGMRKPRNNEFEKILKNFNVSLDGCKGVYTKMKFLDIL